MSQTEKNLEEFLFEAAVQKANAAERAAFLDGACRDNPSLRARLDLLLEGHFAGAGFLLPLPKGEGRGEGEGSGRSPSDLGELKTVPEPHASSDHQMIGRYKIAGEGR